MVQKVSRNRVYRDRLWDDAGEVWRRELDVRLDVQEMEAVLADGQARVVVQTFEGPMQWFSPEEARRQWPRLRRHCEGGALEPVPDERSQTYTGILWRQGDLRLLGLQGRC